jgi:hypothetical protein
LAAVVVVMRDENAKVRRFGIGDLGFGIYPMSKARGLKILDLGFGIFP